MIVIQTITPCLWFDDQTEVCFIANWRERSRGARVL